jgi:ATP-binding cassette subfamily B protein
MARSAPGLAEQKLSKATVRRVLQYAKPYRRQLIAMFVVLAVAAVASVATPVLAGRAVNAIFAKQDRDLVVGLAAAIAGLALLTAVLSMAQRWYSSRVGESLILDLRRKVFSHVLNAPIAFSTRTQTGALISRLNNDVIGAQRAFTGTLSGVGSNAISLIVTVGVMASLSWQITVLSLILVPVFVLPAKWFGRKLQAITREQLQLNASMNTTMTERFNVSGAMLVKLFGRVDEENASFADRAGRVRDIGVQSAMYSQMFFIALTLVAALAQALVYGLGGWLAFAGQLNAGTVVTLALLLAQLYGPLTALSNVRVDVMGALVSFERVFEVLDLPPMVTDKPGAERLPPGARRVEFDDVHFSYPTAEEVSLASLEDVAVLDHSVSEPVLRGVSFVAEPGQMIALVGPSGAGKTTISQLVPRLYDVTAGAVRLEGIDVRDVTQESLRGSIGVVAQDPHMFHDTIEANLRYADPDATSEQIWEALRRAQIADMVRALPDKLSTLVGERGYRLSGGEKQRMAIARLLLKAPSIVILDEATSHLDSESELAVQRALQEALADRTALVIAHRLSTIRDADQILVVECGRIAQRGTHEELLEQGGLYTELYAAQFASTAVG